MKENPQQSHIGNSQRLTAKDWIEKAESELAKSGINAVRVEPLAKKLNVTKGSFYWHFNSRKDLLDQVINQWRLRSTQAIIERLTYTTMEPVDRLRELLMLPYKRTKKIDGSNLELAIRNWAQQDNQVKSVLDEVDNHRLAFIAKNFEALGVNKNEAEVKALRFYCTMQGISILGRSQNIEMIDKIFKTLI
jgi:AcrR family transcriptional regulator